MKKTEQELRSRMLELADILAEREFTAEENAEYNQCKRELLAYEMRGQNTVANLSTFAQVEEQIRSAVEKNQKVKISLVRDGYANVMQTAALANTGIIPISDKEMLKPLREGLIYNKLGLNVQTGLVGTLRWPKHTKAVAAWGDEVGKVGETKIDFSKLEMSGTNLRCFVTVSRDELRESNGRVEAVIREELPAAIHDKINAALLSQDSNARVFGPFANAEVVQFAGAIPTRAELLAMKAKVAKTGIKFSNPGWTMSEDMKAMLEEVKVDAGSGRFLCENDKIFGYPVVVSEECPVGTIGFGDWSYQPAGFFGGIDIIVDPYSKSTENLVVIAALSKFGTATLRQEAFVLGKVHE